MWLVGEGGIYGCGCKEVLDFLILLIPTPLVSVLFCSSIPIFCSSKKMVFILYVYSRDGRLRPLTLLSRPGTVRLDRLGTAVRTSKTGPRAHGAAWHGVAS